MSGLEQRFWAKVNRDGPVVRDELGECWEWTGAKLRGQGYGRVVVAGREVLAHRLAWTLTYGEPPPGLCVCHHCDNRLCTRPAHLFIGTRADNNADRHVKGRSRGPRSENSPMVRLSADDVEQIRKMHQLGAHSQERIGQMFGVSQPTVSQIVLGRTWQ